MFRRGRGEDPDLTRVAVVDPWMGRVVAGRYRLELRIAAGGFGAIYRALDLVADRDVAIKLLHPLLTSDPAVLARFQREGAALLALRDPHTVQAYEVGEADDGSLFIAMELLQGQNLHAVTREEGAMGWRRVVAIARAVCSSLAEAHALGIVHRDLKPANIHLEGEQRDFVKVLDFGIAKIVGGALDQSDLTNAGQMIGTFDYMPPEQMVGGECTGKSDIFTLGVVMYELLVGDRPFGELPTAASMLGAMLAKPPPSPLARGAELPVRFDQIVMSCLAQRPDQRPDVATLAQQLDRLIEDDNDRTVFQPFVEPTTDPVALREPTPTDRVTLRDPAPPTPAKPKRKFFDLRRAPPEPSPAPAAPPAKSVDRRTTDEMAAVTPPPDIAPPDVPLIPKTAPQAPESIPVPETISEAMPIFATTPDPMPIFPIAPDSLPVQAPVLRPTKPAAARPSSPALPQRQSSPKLPQIPPLPVPPAPAAASSSDDEPWRTLPTEAIAVQPPRHFIPATTTPGVVAPPKKRR